MFFLITKKNMYFFTFNLTQITLFLISDHLNRNQSCLPYPSSYILCAVMVIYVNTLFSYLNRKS